MRHVAIMGLVVGACAAAASAETFTFPHVLEISGRLSGTPIGSMEIPYQSTHGNGDITISPGAAPPTTFEYHYEDTPTFHVGVGEGRIDFAVLLRQGGGRTDQDAQDGAMWNLMMGYELVAMVGEVEYRLPGDGLISFIRPSADPQPLPIEGDDDDIDQGDGHRHGAPVVFLIESPLTLFESGDARSQSFVTIDAASRIVIEEAVPAPAAGLGLAVLSALGAGRRRRII
jgi:MYXO-CTERM domain-containing protein